MLFRTDLLAICIDDHAVMCLEVYCLHVLICIINFESFNSLLHVKQNVFNHYPAMVMWSDLS